MYKLGQKICFVADSLEQKLPIGDYGYIIAYDRNPDNAFTYLVRAPKMNKHFYVSAQDVELEDTLIRKEADRIEQEALIDYALATKNKPLFEFIMNGGSEKNDSKDEKVTNANDFVKQVSLKAWI